MSFYPARLVYVGAGRETTFGTPVGPSFWLPCTTIAPADQTAPLPDEGWRGPAGTSFGHSPGPLSSTVQLGGPLTADTFGVPLYGLLGDAATTGSGAPFTTKVAIGNTAQPPSYTLTTYDPSGPLAWAGCQFSQVAVQFDAEQLLTWTGTVSGLSGVSASSTGSSFTAVPAMGGWRGTVTIGGSGTAQIMSGELTVSRAVENKSNTDGSRTPYDIWAGLLTVTGTFTAVADTDTWRGQFVAGSSTSIDLLWQQGSGSSLTSVEAHCSEVGWTKVDRTYGESWIELDMAFTADFNTTDVGASGGWSPILWTLKSAVNGY